mmetsp:Transcript_24254/g.65101  ORF Transcript_24254/g.65101 Transcript_24254/m.65101 type:complete len:81 (-) Transcript_24254:1056-1298(-)
MERGGNCPQRGLRRALCWLYAAWTRTVAVGLTSVEIDREHPSCGVSTDVSETAWVLSIAFYTAGGLLLLNMLIAMMVRAR